MTKNSFYYAWNIPMLFKSAGRIISTKSQLEESTFRTSAASFDAIFTFSIMEKIKC